MKFFHDFIGGIISKKHNKKLVRFLSLFIKNISMANKTPD
jgi:hypothetical protein